MYHFCWVDCTSFVDVQIYAKLPFIKHGELQLVRLCVTAQYNICTFFAQSCPNHTGESFRLESPSLTHKVVHCNQASQPHFEIIQRQPSEFASGIGQSKIYLWIRTSKQNIRRVSGLRQIRAGLAKRPLLRKACQWNAYSFQFLRFSTSPHATAGSSSPQNGAEPIYKDVWRQSHQVGTGTWQKVHPPKPPKTKKATPYGYAARRFSILKHQTSQGKEMKMNNASTQRNSRHST